jgi:response regulator RpfG family c-di-GMP phosphodiesterase
MMNDEHQGSILIVEDDEQLQFILITQLRSAGFSCIATEDGADGVRLAIEKLPDLIIMDVGLPGLDGVAATKALKADARTSSIPVIMLTARSGRDDIIRGLEAGAQEYLPKPFDAELLARVRTVHRLSVARRRLDRLNTQLEVEVNLKTQRLRTLYEFMRDLNHAGTRDEIQDLLVRCVTEATGAERISLFLTNATGEYLLCERAVGIDPTQVQPIPVSDVEGITGQVFRTGQTLAARTYETAVTPERGYVRNSFVSTPLVSTSLETRDGIIGVLNVTEKGDDRPFSEEEIDCIRSVADAAAIALDNVTRRTRLQQSVRVLLQTVGLLAEYRDEETTAHLERVSKLARILADALQRDSDYAGLVTDDFVEMLVQAAPMHDIGKVGISDEILTKPGKLTPEEFQTMKTHTEIGRHVLSRALDPACPVPLLEMCIDIAHCHHERFDGTGYPRRIGGQDIPLAARIIAVVDAYDAITSARRYKEARSHEEAVEIIRAENGRHFDPVIVHAFLRCHSSFNRIRERYADSTDAWHMIAAHA